ncbi:MAG: hypothetical protein ABIT09_10020 [Croceibacterium sp.]
MRDVEDLVDRLCTVIGMIVEDANVGAIVSTSAVNRRETIAALEVVAADIEVLARAAAVLERRAVDWTS